MLVVDFDSKKQNRDFRNAFCDRKMGLNVQETDTRNPVSKDKSKVGITAEIARHSDSQFTLYQRCFN